jgi:carbamoyltransferase
LAKYIIGISAFYHDSAAVMLRDGEIIAAAQEERFTRIKNDFSFPTNALQYILREAGITTSEVDIVAYYEKPFITFERLLETYHLNAPRGIVSFIKAMPIWLKHKLLIKSIIRKELNKFGKFQSKILFPEHHVSHAASAFYPSPFKESAIITIDGVGEWATATISIGINNSIKKIKELHYPNSLGLLYSAFTYFLGFRVNSGEYKLMGLAAYGNSQSDQTKNYIDLIQDKLVDIKEDGSLKLQMEYFKFSTSLTMIHTKRWQSLFKIKKRKPNDPILQEHMDLAYAIQKVTEKIIFKLAENAKKITKSNHLCMAGGVALNCVANGKLLSSDLFNNIWVQPAAGDAGGAVGAAFAAYHIYNNTPRDKPYADLMKNAFLGPEYSNKQVQNVLERKGLKYRYIKETPLLSKLVAEEISKGSVIGWFQGRMEFGPRALGNRSIIADARNPDMQERINQKVKYREDFRPFAPMVLEEDVNEYFDLKRPSPYMLFVANLIDKRKSNTENGPYNLNIMERLQMVNSDIPSVTHVDFSARIQTVTKNTNKRIWMLLNEFKKLTGTGLLINTSFNLKDEPIVCTPEDALRCFYSTDIDILVLNDFLIKK